MKYHETAMVGNGMAIDPVCKMTVDEKKARQSPYIKAIPIILCGWLLKRLLTQSGEYIKK
jgi:hypothetical protein